MTVVSGRDIADEIYRSVAASVATLDKAPKLTAITCAPNKATQQYVALKQRKAAEVGIVLEVKTLPATTTTQELISVIADTASTTDSIVVQLPLPQHIDRAAVLSVIPSKQDPDGFSFGVAKHACLPPVVGAIVAIASHHHISFTEKSVVILGYGTLVGQPMAAYLRSLGIEPSIFTEASTDQLQALAQADIIISGIGKPEYVTRSMVKEGVVIFDAGASEDGGVVRGDVHPLVAEKASLFTPVPGGIEPITVALLLQNVVSLLRS